MAVASAQLESYQESFSEFAKETRRDASSWLRELREAAFARFCAIGFPTPRDEDWRFTNVAALARIPFRLAQRSVIPFTVSDLAQWRMESAIARMVFLDGYFAPQLSAWGSLPQRIIVNSLRQEIAHRPEVVAEHLGRYLDIERDPFCALNTAFAADGAYVHVGRGAVVEQPIHLLFVSTPSGVPAMTHPRNLIVVDDESEASIIEDYVSLGGETRTFSNAVTELVVGGNASVAHTMIEREHLKTYNFSTLRVEQARNAVVGSHSLLLGGALVRNNVHSVLAGEGGECLINGLFIANGSQHLDNYMLVEHGSPRCASRQFYNGVLDDRAHGVFHGRIIVHKDAQKTDAKQTNRNLLLSDDAQIDTKPQLEIHADDVKCTHGATIGQIDENALFYLRSRGLGDAEARQLLLQAFAGEFLDRMKAGVVHNYAELAVQAQLLSLLRSASSEEGGNEEERRRRWQEVG